jgi:hypothetical protein
MHHHQKTARLWLSPLWLSTVISGLLLAGCDRDSTATHASTRPAAAPELLGQLEIVNSNPVGDQYKLTVCLFARTDCPISNSYAPEVRRIHEKFAPRSVGFFLVYADPDENRETILKHLKEYSYPFPALRDPKHELVKLTGAKVTPEAAVFDKDGKLLYRGRIDDRYVDFGKARAAPTQKDLEIALEAILAGKPAPPPGGTAIGCMIPNLK